MPSSTRKAAVKAAPRTPAPAKAKSAPKPAKVKSAGTGYDLIIIGAGFTGLVLALLCGRAGLRTALIDREDPAAKAGPERDGRVTALSAGTRDILERAGLWTGLAGLGEPILDIRVSAEGGRGDLRYRHGDLSGEPMGYMVENGLLRAAWAEALEAAPEVELFAPAEVKSMIFREPSATVTIKRRGRSRTLCAPLIAAADGRESATRAAAGIGVRRYDYRQTALVFTVAHDRPHNGVAEERFLAGGPFALLPMTDDAEHGHRSGVVWTLPSSRAAELNALDPAAFDRALAETAGGGAYGALHCLGRRWAYPLSLQIAKQRTGRRLALIGDAAQAIHPLAGQGLNLGLRDARDLADVLADHRKLGLDTGAAAVLARYDRRRRPDVVSLIAATDGLNRLFSNNIPGLRRLRALGLTMVDALPPLKRRLQARAMGRALPNILAIDPLTARRAG